MAEKSIYTKELGRLIALAARTKTPGKYRVMSSLSNKWMVLPDRGRRALRVFTTQQEAVNFAKKIAAKKNGSVVIHDKTGLVKSRISYAVA